MYGALEAWHAECRIHEYFGIQFTDYNVEVNDVEDTVEKEISGPGKLLGYRAMHRKIREIHGLNVPRDLASRWS